jgi:ribose transport system substrate-binding protein
VARPATVPAASYRFVIIPKVVHPWFDLVHEGARHAARMIEQQTGRRVILDYQPPHKAELAEQMRLLAQATASNPDGIAMDLLDDQVEQAGLAQARRQGIPLVLFDSEPPAGMDLPYVGNDFCEQARLAASRLVTLLGGEGEVAIMLGVPTAVNHRLRAACHERVFQAHPGIKLVAKGIDNDNIDTAREQAKAIMAAHPQVRGWVSCDAGGVIGIGQAIKEAKLTGKVFNVGLDDLPETIQLIREGVADSSYATKPRTQGYWAIITLWQAKLGAPMLKDLDTGMGIVTRDNADHYRSQ